VTENTIPQAGWSGWDACSCGLLVLSRGKASNGSPISSGDLLSLGRSAWEDSLLGRISGSVGKFVSKLIQTQFELNQTAWFSFGLGNPPKNNWATQDCPKLFQTMTVTLVSHSHKC